MSRFDIFSKSRISDSKKVFSIVTSLYPLEYFTSIIGGERIEVMNMVPLGAEPHDFEPTPQDIKNLEEADAVILNGLGMEPWADFLGKDPRVQRIGEGLASLKSENGEFYFDPHVWLDPVLAQAIVSRITLSLVQLDSEHASEYQASSLDLLKRLDELHQSFLRKLQDCEQSTVVTSHAAFGYLAKRYGFEQMSVEGFSPQSDPSPRRIAEIVEFMKTNRIQYVFQETLVSPHIVQTLASEIGARPLVLNPLEGLTQQETTGGQNYFTIQAVNLNNLVLALQCKNGD